MTTPAGRRRTATVATAAVAALAVAALGWGPIRSEVGPLFGLGPPGDRIDMCGMEHPSDVTVMQIDVYNFHGRSSHADHHQVPREDIEWVCADHLTFLSTGQRVDPDDMEGVPVTVFVLTWSDTDAPRNPIYVYWLKNKKGMAVTDLGVTYFVPHGTLMPYYAPDAERIQRAQVPPR